MGSKMLNAIVCLQFKKNVEFHLKYTENNLIQKAKQISSDMNIPAD